MPRAPGHTQGTQGLLLTAGTGKNRAWGFDPFDSPQTGLHPPLPTAPSDTVWWAPLGLARSAVRVFWLPGDARRGDGAR